MVILNERITQEESTRIEAWRVSLFMDKSKMDKFQFDDLAKKIFDEYKEHFFKASTLFEKTKYPKIDKQGKKKSFINKPISAHYYKDSHIEEFDLAIDYTQGFINKFKVPDRNMSIVERGITSKEHYISFTGEINFKDSNKQQPIKEDLFNFLKAHKLIWTIADDDKAFYKVYEFTDKFYGSFYKYFDLRMSKNLYHEIKKSYKKQSMDIVLVDDKKFYEKWGEAPTNINPDLIKEKRFVDKKKAVSHFIVD